MPSPSQGENHHEPERSRIAILGANGRLGQALNARFRFEHTVIPLGRETVDLARPESIRNLEALDFDLLYLPAALTAVDYCESHPDEAFAVNAEGPREVARICAGKRARLVHISTDFVFDGTKEGPYGEDDPPHPISVYAASKLQGERHVLDAAAENLVVRLSWLFGPGKPAFPEWIIDQACAKECVTLPSEKTGNPTAAPDVADWLACLLQAPTRAQATGLLHLCNAGTCTWQEWGQACIDLAIECNLPVKARHIGATTLDAIPAFVAKRPVNSALSTAKFESLTGITPRPWQEALREHVKAKWEIGKFEMVKW